MKEEVEVVDYHHHHRCSPPPPQVGNWVKLQEGPRVTWPKATRSDLRCDLPHNTNNPTTSLALQFLQLRGCPHITSAAGGGGGGQANADDC